MARKGNGYDRSYNPARGEVAGGMKGGYRAGGPTEAQMQEQITIANLLRRSVEVPTITPPVPSLKEEAQGVVSPVSEIREKPKQELIREGDVDNSSTLSLGKSRAQLASDNIPDYVEAKEEPKDD